MRSGNIFVISAPSGAGKTTLFKMLMQSDTNLRPSVSYTSRQPRQGEVDDVDYTFVGAEKFREMVRNGEFVEWAEVHGNLYGTSRRRLYEIRDAGYDVMLDIDTQGASQIRVSFSDGIFIFILPPSMTVLRERLESRMTNTPEDIERRLGRAKDEIKDYHKYDYVIVNDNLEEALKRLQAVITAERSRSSRIDPVWIEEKFV